MTTLRMISRNFRAIIVLMLMFVSCGSTQLVADVDRKGALELIVDNTESPKQDCLFDIRARLINRSDSPAFLEKGGLDKEPPLLPSIISIFLQTPNGSWKYLTPQREIPATDLIRLNAGEEVRTHVFLRNPFLLHGVEKPINLTGELRAGIRYFDTGEDWKAFKEKVFSKSAGKSEATHYFHEVFSKNFTLPHCSNTY